MKRKAAARGKVNRLRSREKSGWLWISAIVLALAALGFGFWQNAGSRKTPDVTSRAAVEAQVASVPPPPVPRSSEYLNTTARAQYIGSERCRDCHDDEQSSYLETAHARSFRLVDPATEPADGTFDHELSRRRLRAYREGGQFRHSESLLLASGGELELYDRSLKYLVGSGRFARTYLTEIDGSLIESPLSWYSSLKAWRMSPGYDVARHSSFRRDIDADCLYCHVGRTENATGSLSRLTIPELAIGCERCHGPGSIHAGQREADRSPATGQLDLSIVNPRRLPRELAEAICNQCHLESVASAIVRGRKRDEFRPGLAWNDFVVNYSYQQPGGSMTVTGHVEQMHASRCYQKSDSLRCTACHDPHHVPPPDERRAHYRAACLACHDEAACRAVPALRLAQNQDDCSACHMPRSAVEIPHLAFTHHRIGIHTATPDAAINDNAAATALAAVLDVSRLSEIDRQWALGLAYWRHHAENDDSRLPTARQRAKDLLSQVAERGFHSGAIAAPLAAMALEEGDVLRAKAEAEWELTDNTLSPRDRVLASELLAAVYVQENRLADAVALLDQLIVLRPHPKYWFLLGVCRQGQGDIAGAVKEFESFVAIDPAEPAAYRALATLYQIRGDAQAARRNAALLEANLPK